ncbi:MAG TPA: undecaprenyl-diphosphate phosphatase [Candidatus Krumholzibacteria bacterium]|nr:undecaprenyl-diphosphate phosphatase [Candidatus Krumholzibacteria bacterium]HPD72796.1 undecaprenyl-diphosphate phosphatase [Candidatus Krumholzibacteria bacterium]HRY40272.1 undecaprenyl-diphosphate phosphatase [Candidatus Krumholzibacteria bacterium]
MLDILLLAVVQGMTEFLPVSSSGHLVLVQHLLGAREGDLFLDVVLHCGTLGSVLAAYRRDILRLLRLDRDALGYVLALAVATLPAIGVGLFLKDVVERIFAEPVFAAAGLIVTGVVLLSTRAARSAEDLSSPWEPRPVPLAKALLVGCAQAIAICPGVSRSGSTIAASLWLKLGRAEAARFSFLLSVPAILGALVLHLLEGDLATRSSPAGLVVAAAVAFAVGLLAIRWTALAVVQSHFWKFAFYVLPLGVLALWWLRG